MKQLCYGLCSLMLLPVAVVADDVSCQFGDKTRRVEVHYSVPDQPVPCEVRYYKDTESPGEVQVLWNAQNEPDYCEARAGEFVATLSGWGWSCATVTAVDDSADVMPADESTDTDSGDQTTTEE